MIPANLVGWARDHGVTAFALHELSLLLGMDVLTPPPPAPGGKDEAWVQSLVRLEAARSGVRLWRNNVGVLEDRTGRPVRYGLANDSERLNKKLKSADLIGWRRLHIEPRHVGTVVAQFVSRECKAPGWNWSGSDREVAQAAWAQLVAADGGDASFTTGGLSL